MAKTQKVRNLFKLLIKEDINVENISFKRNELNNIVATYFFEEDADKLVKFQNKNRVWEMNGGIPKFLWCNNI